MNASTMRGAALLGLLLLLAPAAARGQGKEPTAAEKEQWQRAKELTEAARQNNDIAMDVEHERSYADPYYSDDKTGDHIKKKFDELAVYEREIAPLVDAVKAIEAKYGTDADALVGKVWAEYGKPVVQGERGFERYMSPDSKKWLPRDVAWPFTFYKDAKKYVEAPAKWRALVVTFAEKKINNLLEYHPKNYDPTKYKKVGRDRGQTKPFREHRPPLAAVVEKLPDDARAKALLEKLDAEHEKWKKIEEDLIDDTEWSPHEPIEGDLGEILDAVSERLKKWDDKKEPMAIRISGGWEVYSHNLLGEPTCYYLWVDAAYESEEDDVAHVHQLKVYTPEGRGVNRGPPFGDVYDDGVYLIRPGNVSQQGGGGLLGTLFKLVAGLFCCFLFLGVVGGGGYFAYKQMNAQKAAAEGGVAPGAPQAAPPGAPPAAPPAPPAG